MEFVSLCEKEEVSKSQLKVSIFTDDPLRVGALCKLY